MKVLVVMAHSRRDSLTGQIADAVAAGLADAGHQAEIADLYGEGFDPLTNPTGKTRARSMPIALRLRSRACSAMKASSWSSRSGGGPFLRS
jgi:putative NADPH-quinone reductase